MMLDKIYFSCFYVLLEEIQQSRHHHTENRVAAKQFHLSRVHLSKDSSIILSAKFHRSRKDSVLMTGVGMNDDL